MVINYELRKVLNVARKAAGAAPSIEKPVALQIPINDICNSKCVMCDIWKNKDEGTDFSLDEFKNGLSDTLFSEVTSIGVNGGEPTLRKELFEIINIAFEVLPKLKNVSIITNGFQNHVVHKKILQLETLVHEKGGALDVMVSLDGIGDIHSKVRGRPQYFERTSKLLMKLKSDLRFSTLRVGCTVVKQNCYHLHDILDFCMQNEVYVKFRLGIEHKRLYNTHKKHSYQLDYLQKLYFIDFLNGLIENYETSEDQNIFYRSLIEQLNGSGKRIAGCDWQYRGATITSNGSIAYCAVKSPEVSKLESNSIQKDYFSNQIKLHSIIQKSCDTCNHDYTGLPSGRLLRRKIYAKLLRSIGVDGLSIKTLVGPFRKKYLSGLRGYLGYMKESDASLKSTIKAKVDALPTKKILLAGWYGTETLGDKAILYGVMKSLRERYGNLNFTVLSFNKDISQRTLALTTNEKYAHEIIEYSSSNLKIESFDAVYFAGGPIMALEEIFDILKVFRSAKQLGVKTGILGCGVGPFGSYWHNLGIKKLFDFADDVVLRDKGSHEIMRRRKFNSCPIIAGDPSGEWLSEFNAPSKYFEKIENLNEKDVINIGLALRKYPKDEYAPGWSRDLTQSYEKQFGIAINDFISQLTNRYEKVNVLLMPMCTNFIGGDDRFYLRKLISLNHKNVIVKNDFCNEELPAEAYLEGFSEMDFLLAMRFHSVVFGTQLSIPTLAIDYTLGAGKIKFLSEEQNIPLLDYRNVTKTNLSDEFTKFLSHDRQPPTLNPGSFASAINLNL